MTKWILFLSMILLLGFAMAQTLEDNTETLSQDQLSILAQPCDDEAENQGPRLVLRRSDEILPRTHDPVWRLIATDGNTYYSFRALTGRAWTQDADRDEPDSKAPLPMGHYIITTIKPVPDWLIEEKPEYGESYYMELRPLFETDRMYGKNNSLAFGIHHDLSFGIPNGQSGTVGCIGLDSAEHMDELTELVKKYDIKDVYVCD